MKVVVQRVSKASLTVDGPARNATHSVAGGRKISEIGKGLLVLIGIKDEDTQKDAEILAEKIAKLRVMADKEDKMNLTVGDVGGEMLVVSQFTLYADTSAGNRPSFTRAARPEIARPIYEHFVEQLKLNMGVSSKGRSASGRKVKTGIFGEYMEIETTLDGPVTIVLEG